MKKLLTILLVLFSFTAMAQPCADEDTVRSNAVSLITATTVRVNGSISHFTSGYTTLYMIYVRVGQTDTATASGVSPLRNLTGLQPNTQYYYYYKTICVSGTNRQIGPYYFTTAVNTIAYATERSTVFPYVKVDSGFKVPRQDTSTFRAPSTGGGDIVFKTSDSTMYYYNGTRWTPMAVDSGGYLALLNNKVDSVTVDSVTNILYYWKQGVSYGYALPLDSAYVNATAVDDSTLRFYRLSGDSTDVELRGTAGSAIDTANKWVNTIYRKPGQDSIFFNIGGTEYAVKDSLGGGGGSSTNVDSTIRLPITFTTPSIIQGTSHFAGTIPGANYAPVKLASDMLGFTVVNQAVAGSSLMSIMETTYRGHQQFRRDSARFVESGWNDANNDYNANTAMRYYNVMKSTVTDQFLDTAIAANSASLSKVGTWSTYNTYTNAYGKAPFLTGGAGLGQTTSTVSDSIIWVSPISTSVVVQGIGDYSTNLGSYTIWIDGVLKDTVNCQNQTTDISSAFDPFAVTKVPLVKVYDNLSNTTHTVVIKNISGTIIIDYVGTLRPNWEDQQPIYLHSTLRSQAKGFSQQIIGGGNSVIEEMNKMGRQVVKEFKALNPNNKVFFIDINKSVDYDKDFYTDGVHLTSLGTKKQANDIINFITSPLSKYNAIDIPYLNYVAANDYPPLAGIQLQQPTATGQDNIGTIRMGNDIFLRWYANNIGLGKGAWNSHSTAINSIAIGDGSQGTGLQTVGYNYTLGVQAGLALTSGTKNFFGNFQTGLAANSASDNNIIGYRAFVNATDATDNNGFGTQGLLTNVHGSRNTFFGTNSLVFNEGSDNFTGGYFSGFNALTTDGSIYIGNKTAYNATAADYSIAIGTGVDLPSATTAGQLNIGNLIYGNNLYQSLTPSSTPVTGGKIGIGNSTPTALLHLAAGTATAGTAPIKLNTGTALTTPEDGAIEYHGSHIYFTIGSTRYQLDQQGGTNIYNSDGTLTGDRTVDGNGNDLTFTSSTGTPLFNVEYNKIILTSLNSNILMQGDSIILDAESHLIHIDSLLQSVAPTNKMVVWDSVGKKLYSQTIPSAGGLSASNFVFNETPSGTINGVNTTFTLANTPTAGTVRVFLRGLRMKLTTDYTISGSTITMINIPGTGDDLITDYLK